MENMETVRRKEYMMKKVDDPIRDTETKEKKGRKHKE